MTLAHSTSRTDHEGSGGTQKGSHRREHIFTLVARSLGRAGGDSDGHRPVVVTHCGGGWSLAEADSILVNGKKRVRHVALSIPHPDTWDSKAISRLPDVPWEGFWGDCANAGREAAPDGRLLARWADTARWVLLLPDNVKEKEL